jgi:hypothetical protein
VRVVIHEDGEEDFGFGGDDRPEDAQIADRGKPQPVDQEIAVSPSSARPINDSCIVLRKAKSDERGTDGPNSMVEPTDSFTRRNSGICRR